MRHAIQTACSGSQKLWAWIQALLFVQWLTGLRLHLGNVFLPALLEISSCSQMDCDYIMCMLPGNLRWMCISKITETFNFILWGGGRGTEWCWTLFSQLLERPVFQGVVSSTQIKQSATAYCRMFPSLKLKCDWSELRIESFGRDRSWIDELTGPGSSSQFRFNCCSV